MTNRRLGYFLDRRIVLLSIAGTVVACAQTSGLGCFSPAR
jgi:hypothetical protein